MKSRKRALAGRAQIIAALRFQEWRRDPTNVPVADHMAALYERGWRDCMAAARKELGRPHSLAESARAVDRLSRFLRPLR